MLVVPRGPNYRVAHQRALTIVLCLLATPALADVASVIDGDTLEVQGQRIRLHAIDAPESPGLSPLLARLR